MSPAEIERILDDLRTDLLEPPDDSWNDHVEEAMNAAWDKLLALEIGS